jgi:hypothetical protein
MSHPVRTDRRRVRLAAVAMSACVVLGALTSGALATSAAAVPGRVALDSRCDELQGLVPGAALLVTGDAAGARKQARALRDLAGRELVPARIKPALRKLAHYFAIVHRLTLVERATALAGLGPAIRKVITYMATTCSGAPTTITSVLR